MAGVEGVVWSPRTKATCPQCGKAEVSPYKTWPWAGKNRVRYHKCPNCQCLFKSIEEDS